MFRARRRAFTILELTIVVLLLGVIAAIGVARFGEAVLGFQVQASARTLAAHIDRVRMTAINEGRNATLTFTDASATYQSPDVDFASRPGHSLQVTIDKISMLSNLGGYHEVQFDLEGVPHANGSPLTTTGTISLSAGGETFVVRVLAGTGRTEVGRPETETTEPETDGYSGASVMESYP